MLRIDDGVSRQAVRIMMRRVTSDFLFAQPSFTSGAARTLDLWGQFDDYNLSETANEADAKAIASDWLVVGQDLSDTIMQNESELQAA
jgi:hypothetical protein